MGRPGFPPHGWLLPVSALPVSSTTIKPFKLSFRLTQYSVFPFIFPIQKYLYLVLFIVVQIWTIVIHDGDMITGHWTEKFINSPAHHTLHHMYFTVNYGQYFTWCDNYFDSHRAPQPELDPIHDALKVMRAKGLVDEKGNPIPKKKSE